MISYRVALSILLIQQSTMSTAFQTTSTFSIHQHRYTSSSQINTASIESTSTTLESILIDDTNGNINSELASAIYEWELAHNNCRQHSDKESFSTRDGLRLVDELAREMLSSLGQDTNQEDHIGGGASGDIAPTTTRKGLSYNDLVQEGMISLLRAMSTYDNYKQHNSKVSTFEEYAKQSITSSFLQYMAQSSQIRLPLSIQTTLQSANVAATKLRQSLGKEPTLTQVANEVQIDPEKLLLYRKLYKSKHGSDAYVSVEDGLEIYDPTLSGVGEGYGLSSRIDTDGDNNKKVDSSSTTESTTASTTSVDILSDNEQELLAQINFQEDDWTNDPPERSVSPLKDVLTDTEELNNPLSYTHHYLINEELNEFLKETLTEEELIIIQLRFGLVDSKYGGKGWSAKDIGRRLNMDHDEVVTIASVALDKLRMNKEEMENDDNDAYVEVSL